MKKLVLAGIFISVIAIAGLFVFRSIRAQDTLGTSRVSKHAAESLQTKIDKIKRNEASPDPPRAKKEIEVTEAELESYVVFSLRDKIPVQMDSISVQLTPGAVGADTQLTFNSSTTGNQILDALVGGTHNLSVRGRLSDADGLGKFDLDEVRVDGIPVPRVLIESLVEKYVKPKYPEVDLKAPFDLPWGIQSIDIGQGKAKIIY